MTTTRDEQTIMFKIVNGDRTSFVVHRDSRFSLKYLKDAVVYAIPGLIGISVFNTLAQAQSFSRGFFSSRILRVIPIGEKMKIEKIAPISIGDSPGLCTRLIEDFLSESTNFYSVSHETLFYPAVRVLD